MTQTSYRPGETALVIAVPEVEPAVGAWRRRFDSAAAAGVPAHVTVLYPFLDIGRVDTAALAALFGGHRAFDVRFEQSARFPEVLYLAPTPERPFRELTEAVAARWPRHTAGSSPTSSRT
ncbi:2'-5' RNA ligase family protein [Phytomonospora sp. NPDC050363]|uniref:2'-5' RNA ligase family protein n=1 Tax=Phytomonospora sp. NPDC050363 TaxID=3155642 RepID=UPI0033DE1DB9